MERLFQLLEKLAASLRYVWWIVRIGFWPVLVHTRTAWFPTSVLRSVTFIAPVLRALSGTSASSVIPLTKRMVKRSLRATHYQATGHWSLVRHGADSLTPLDLLLNRFTEKRR